MDESNTKSKVKPEIIPKPSYWPFMLVVSLLFVGWGMISYWIICLMGIIGFFIALSRWIKEMIDE